MSDPPSVSVVIPAYNVEDCISRAIRSVFRQTLLPREILVVDDGSTDDTRHIANRFGVPVRVLSQPRQGAAQARNAGIRACSGDIIAFLDADDEWLDSKLEKQLELHRGREIVLSFCRSNEFDGEGNDLGDTFRDLPYLRGSGIWRNLLAANFIATPTVMASRAHLVAAGGFDPGLKVGEDQDMWIRLALRGSVDFIDESLVCVHMRPNNLSGSGFHDQLFFTLPMIWRHLRALKPRLTEDETRAICAERLGRVARNAYAHGEFAIALPLMARAIGTGDSLLHNIYHLAAAAPPVRRLRGVMKRRIFSTGAKSPAAAGRRTQ